MRNKHNPAVSGRAVASFVALGCIGFIASAPAAAQEESGATRLEGVTVRDSAVEEGYKADAISSPKATAALVDTPRTVNVITQDVLEDTASFSFEEALRTVPGITLGAGEGGVASADIPLIRGVDATGDVFVDGARDIGSQTRETFAVERVEVFKGPSSAFGGRGAAAGGINIVSKLAKRGGFANATLTAGTDDFKRISVDVNQQFGESIAFRVAGLWHDADTPGRDAVHNERWGIAPSLTWFAGESTRATLAYYHYETDGIPDYGIPLTSRNQLPGGVRLPAETDPDNFYGLLSRDFQRTNVDSATFIVEHDFGNGWVLTNTARYSDAINDYIVTNPDDSAGNVVNDLVWRAIKSRSSNSESFADALNLSGVFETGGIGHSISIGAEYSVADSSNLGYTVDTGDRTCPASELANYNCTTLDSPDPSDPWNGSVTHTGTPSIARAEDFSLYAFDTITIVPQLLLNAGVRWTTYSASGEGVSRGTPFEVESSSDFWSWQGALIFKPTEQTSLYFSYANSKTPPGTTVGEGAENLSATNELYEPQATENWEIGGKAELLDGALLLSAALFQVDRKNIIQNDPVAGPTDVFSAARLKGFELGVNGRAGPVSVFAGYTYIDSELRDGSANEGKKLPQTPEHNFSGTVSVQVTPQFKIGGGAYHASKRYADAANLIWADGYWRFDANATYDVNDHIGVRLNVQNVTDERYFTKLRNPHFAVPADGRRALVSLILRY